MSKWLAAGTTKAHLHALAAFDQAARLGDFRRDKRGSFFCNPSSSSTEDVGDPDISDDALDARCSLRYNRDVVAELRRFIHILEAYQRKHKLPLAIVKEQLYKDVFTKVCLAMTKKATEKQMAKIVNEDWDFDCRGRDSMSTEQVKDALFELADMWCDTVDATEYIGFLVKLRQAIATVDGTDFLVDDLIMRGAARPPGFDEQDFLARRKDTKSKFMQDAQDKAKERYEAAQLVQAKARAAQAKKEAKEAAWAKQSVEEAALKNELRAQLGRDPTAAEVNAYRDAALLERLRRENGGREPSEAEIAAAREAELRQRMTAKNGTCKPPHITPHHALSTHTLPPSLHTHRYTAYRRGISGGK